MANSFSEGFAVGLDSASGRYGSGRLQGRGPGRASEWGLYDEVGGDAVVFDSMESVEIRAGGAVLAEPVELGSFASYNKTLDPVALTVKLIRQGDPAGFEEVLEKLLELRREPRKITLATPAYTWGSFTLESFGYSQSAAEGCGLLIAELELKEVREVETSVTTEVAIPPKKAKSATSASKQGTGKASGTKTEEPKKPNRSLLESGRRSLGGQ
jgi:hypothetical protein